MMNDQPTGRDSMDSNAIGESSAAEHWPLKPGDGGSNPPPRTTSDDPCDECGHRHTSAAVAEDHRASFKGRTPPFEGEDGGSTPPARSTPELRRGYEITLENGTTVGWFHTRNDDIVLSVGGGIYASFTREEWPVFLGYAMATAGEAEAPPPAATNLSEEQARMLYAECENTVQALLDQATRYARMIREAREEAAQGRIMAAEALQALEEATGVIERQTAILEATEDEAARREATIASQMGTIAALNEENERLAGERQHLAAINSEQARIIQDLRREGYRRRQECDRAPCSCGEHRDRT